MKIGAYIIRLLFVIVMLSLSLTSSSNAQKEKEAGLKKDQLAQLVAPVALYPDALLTQILIASTYPLEVVQADRWVVKNKSLKGDALTKALDGQKWDPSVKALVNFPTVLKAMSEKLEQTTKLGDAFLAQPKELMAVVQELRAKAYAAGNLKSTKEQNVVVEKEIIIIESTNPQVVYVPSYSPTVVYGTWGYPAYPPYYYYPPPPAYTFSMGVAVGSYYGYGHCDWHGGNVYVQPPPPPPPPAGTRPPATPPAGTKPPATPPANRPPGSAPPERPGSRPPTASTLPASERWQHDPSHRKGVAYRDQQTSQKYNRVSTNDAARTRDAYRGRTDGGSQTPGRNSADKAAASRDTSHRGPGGYGQTGYRDSGSRDTSSRGGAFDGMDRGGAANRDFSNRGSSSRQSFSSGGGGSRGGGGGFSGGGGARGGGGGGRGGGRR